MYSNMHQFVGSRAEIRPGDRLVTRPNRYLDSTSNWKKIITSYYAKRPSYSIFDESVFQSVRFFQYSWRTTSFESDFKLQFRPHCLNDLNSLKTNSLCTDTGTKFMLCSRASSFGHCNIRNRQKAARSVDRLFHTPPSRYISLKDPGGAVWWHRYGINLSLRPHSNQTNERIPSQLV
jgi:hypothetical protein